MSAISTFLNQIKTAIYGEQVRDAIHDSILQCYTDVTNGVTLAQNAASSAGRAATDANGAANQASAAAYNASTAASSATTAANAATAAANNASNAKEAANAAAQVATSAANQANDAATAANAAAQAANTAKTNADTATQAANTAAEAANTAATNANTAKDDAVAATEAVNAAAETINGKAIKSGTELDLTAGTAEQLVSDETVLDTEPYKLRKTAGSGNRAYLDKIIGGSVVWNQLAMFDNPQIPTGRSGLTFASSNGKAVIINGTNTSDANTTISGWFGGSNAKSFGDDRLNHVILITSAVVSGTTDKDVFIYLSSTLSALRSNFAVGGSTIVKVSGATGATRRLDIVVQGSTVLNDYTITLQYFDLTQTFGSTIADYVYNLEQANAGAGVELFRKIFPADYYPYNAGELISVSGLSEHKTVGFNLWDEEWENGWIDNTGKNRDELSIIRSKNYISVTPDTTYFFKFPVVGTVVYYDSNKNCLGNVDKNGVLDIPASGAVRTTPSNCHYVRFWDRISTYSGDICINLSDPARNGEYEPYAGHFYPLDSSLVLRGIPKLDAENNLHYDGDEYTPDGKVNRRFGVVDLGTLSWGYNTSYADSPYFYTGFQAKYIGSFRTTIYPLINAKYTPATRADIVGDGGIKDKIIALDGGAVVSQVQIRDSAYIDAAAFKAAMSGVMLVYELATPTEESAEPYAQVQVIDPAGTEEFVSESILPVGHETRYMVDLKDRLEHLPDKAVNDGLYAIQQTDGKMELVNATFSPGVVENASGAIASFSDGADNVPVKNLVVNIEPVQAGSGDPSPDNVRPISGWTGVRVSRAGKNLFNANNWENNKAGLTVIDNNSFRLSSVSYVEQKNKYLLPKTGTYTLTFHAKVISTNNENAHVYLNAYKDTTGVASVDIRAGTQGDEKDYVLQIPATADSIKFHSWGNTATIELSNIQLELGSTATDYESYSGETYVISLPSEAGTVYGGTLDVVSGVLTVDRAMVTLDGTETWTKPDNCFYTTKYKSESDYPLGVSSHYKVGGIYGGVNGINMRIGIAKAGLRIHDENYGSSITDFVAGLTSSPVTLVYELATPITYQLTPTQVKTLLGENNIFADTGDVNVDYIADTKLYIDKKFTELQALVLENVGG